MMLTQRHDDASAADDAAADAYAMRAIAAIYAMPLMLLSMRRDYAMRLL